MGGPCCCALSFVMLFVVVFGNRISDRRLCGDPKCSEPVSYARTLIRYASNAEGILSFASNQDAVVFSKSAGSRQDLWGVKINGKRGYAPKGLLREYKILKKNLTYVVPTEEHVVAETHKNNSNTVNDTPQNEGSVSPKESIDSNSEHAPLLPSDEQVSKGEVGKEQTEDNPLPFQDGITQPFELVDGTTIYLPPEENSQAELLPIQATMTSGMSSSIQVEAVTMSVDSAPKLEPSTLNTQENEIKTSTPPSSPVSGSDPKLQPSTLSMQENIMNSGIPSSSPVSEGEKDLDEKTTLPETEIETEGSADIYTMFTSWISEGSGTPEQKSVPEQTGGTESAEKSLGENSGGEQKKETAASEDQKQTEDESEEEEDEDEDDYGDEYDDDEDDEEDESTSQKTSGTLVNGKSGKEASAQNEKLLEHPTENNILPEKVVIEEETSNEDTSKNTVTGKSEYHRDVEVVFDSADEESSPHNGTTSEEKQSGDNINADDKAVDAHGTVSLEELSGSVEKVTSTVVLPGHGETANIIQSVNNIPDLKNEDGTEETTNEISTSSSDAEGNLSYTSSAEITLDDSGRITLESESLENSAKVNVNERQEPSKQEEDKPGESSYGDLQPEVTVDNLLPEQDEQSVSSAETPPSISDEISTVSADDSADAEVNSEIVSEEQSSNGLFSGIAGSFWSSFENVVHIFTDGSKEQLSESTGPDDVQELQDVSSKKMTEEAVPSPRSEPLSSTVSFTNKEETQACVVVDSAAGIDSDCDVIDALSRAYKKPQETDEPVSMDMQKSFNTVLYLIITAFTVLLFSLGHYYMEKKRRDGSLVAKINELEKALLVSSKECIILKDDLEATKEKLQSIEHSSTDSIETVATLNIQLQEAKVANAALEEQVASLEKELEQATEAGLELNRMLTEFLSTQHGSDSLMKSVEHLQKQLDSQQGTITTMTESLNVKNAENENLQIELKVANEKIHSLEEELQKVTEKLEVMQTEKMKIIEESADKSKEFEKRIEEITKSKEDEVSTLKFELIVLQDSVTELKDSLVTKESEIAVLQDCIKQMKNYDDGDDTLQALLDVGETKAELKLMTLERNTLLEKLQIEEDARKLLEDHVKVIKEEVVRLRESYEEAEKEKTEAQTRLEVLSNYFKEKETQLQKELGLQEAMCLQKEGDATSTHEQIKSLKEEIENYKSQNEALKKEILDQERGLKGQISSLEKKAHENWIAARQAERKLEETKQEAGQLRNRLTVVEKNITNVSKNGETTILNDRMPADSNGDLGASPVHAALADSSSSPLHYHDGLPSPPLPVLPLAPTSFMGMHPGVFIPPPPPPGAPFMPPPPPPPLFPGDRRPPPLGRMSSPPPPRRYSSPPPPESRSTFSPYEHSPPTSPLPPDRRYRSPPPPINESPSRFKHTSPPPPLPHFSTRLPPHWDDPHGTPRSGFRPLPPPTHRDSPREPKGSTLSSGHSSESLEKSSRHSGRV